MDWMSFRTLTEAFQGYIADGLSPEIKNKTKTKNKNKNAAASFAKIWR